MGLFDRQPLTGSITGTISMVNISHESPEETDRRLRLVIAMATFHFYDQAYAFKERPVSERPDLPCDALAIVRDDEVWSSLVPAQAGSIERFAVWRFHFPTGVENSGFVGWLASLLKATLGTGVFVVCGQNSARGGIFDYWGCPWKLREQVRSELLRLRSL